MAFLCYSAASPFSCVMSFTEFVRVTGTLVNPPFKRKMVDYVPCSSMFCIQAENEPQVPFLEFPYISQHISHCLKGAHTSPNTLKLSWKNERSGRSSTGVGEPGLEIGAF